MASDRKWRVEKSGEYFRGKQHGAVVVKMRNGRPVDEIQDPVTKKIRVRYKLVQLANPRMGGDEIERRLAGMLVRVR